MKKILLLFSILIFTTSCIKKTAEEDFLNQNDSVKIDTNKSKNISNENEIEEPEWVKIEIPNSDLTTEQIINFIGTLRGWMYQPNKSNIDITDLADKLSDRIVSSINSQKSYDLNKILKLNAQSEKENIKIYSLGHDSGGTRGFINYPIIVWGVKNKKQCAFNLSKDIKCEFEEIHKLTKDLYLLIGYESGSGAGYQSIVYVIEIKNDKLNNKYCAFVKRPYLNFQSGSYSYNKKTKILEFKLDEQHSTDNLDNVFYYADRYGEYETDTITAEKMKLMIEDEYYAKRTFKLKFDGKKFVGLN